MTLGTAIRSIRKEHNFTLKDLAMHAGLSVTYLSELERDRINPSVNSVQKIAIAFHMPLNALFCYPAPPETPQTPPEPPPGFQAFIEDPEYADELHADWKTLLLTIHYRGKRPNTKRKWIEIYLFLKRLLTPPACGESNKGSHHEI